MTSGGYEGTVVIVNEYDFRGVCSDGFENDGVESIVTLLETGEIGTERHPDAIPNTEPVEDGFDDPARIPRSGMDLESFVQIENRLSGAGKQDVCVGVNVVVVAFGGVDTLFEACSPISAHIWTIQSA